MKIELRILDPFFFFFASTILNFVEFLSLFYNYFMKNNSSVAFFDFMASLKRFVKTIL